MLKKLTKFLLFTLVLFILSNSWLVCFAHEENELTNTVTTTESNETANTTDETTSTTPEIYSGDLYLFGNNLIMDKFVDGNVFILGNNVKITGQVNGSLYVLANQVTFDNCVIRYSIFGCANYVYFCNNSGTYENDIYIAANKLDTTWDSYAARDFKIIASNVTLKSGVGRDVDLICNTLNLGEDKDRAEIYGDLRYTANSEIAIPEGAVAGSTTYSKQSFDDSVIGDILMSFGTCIITALAAYIILSKLAPKFVENISNNKLSALSLLKAFGIGLATIATVIIFMILLAGTGVGITLAFILGLLFVILYIIATPIFAIRITKALKHYLKLEKTPLFYLVLALISIILYGITLIPVLGFILGLIINVIAIGLIVNVFLPQKELTDEEKAAIEEKEKQVKEIKEKRKQEKLKAKATKKETKIKTKTSKKEEKNKVKNDKKQAKESKKNDQKQAKKSKKKDK